MRAIDCLCGRHFEARTDGEGLLRLRRSHMDGGRPQMQATAVQMCRRIAAGACVAATV
jgi:hypothetical protein